MSKTDDVIEAAEQRLAEAQRRLDNLTQRREREARGVATHTGHVRPAIAERVAALDVQVEALRTRVAEAESALKNAVDDLPRRQRERKRIAALDRELANLAETVETKRAALADAEAAVDAKRAERDAATRAASTVAEIETEAA